MTFVVPFDGSALGEAAFLRAGDYARAPDEDLVALSVVPEGRQYAVRKGWIEDGAEFSARQVIADLNRQVAALAPEGSFLYRRT